VAKEKDLGRPDGSGSANATPRTPSPALRRQFAFTTMPATASSLDVSTGVGGSELPVVRLTPAHLWDLFGLVGEPFLAQLPQLAAAVVREGLLVQVHIRQRAALVGLQAAAQGALPWSAQVRPCMCVGFPVCVRVSLRGGA
jgi:hypothetical protein